MNDKGFSLIELVLVLAIISTLTLVITFYIGNTLSISREEAYSIMKDNIVSVSYDYINECDNDFLVCDYVWNDGRASFSSKALLDSGYVDDLTSPIDDVDLSLCLIINATKVNGVLSVTLEDNCY